MLIHNTEYFKELFIFKLSRLSAAKNAQVHYFKVEILLHRQWRASREVLTM